LNLLKDVSLIDFEELDVNEYDDVDEEEEDEEPGDIQVCREKSVCCPVG